MADYTHTDLQVVGRHVPDGAGGPFDSMDHAKAAGHDTINPVTGVYEIGVIIEGAFYPFLVEKASLVFDRIEAAKAQASADAASEPQPTAPAEGEAAASGPQAGGATPAQPYEPQG